MNTTTTTKIYNCDCPGSCCETKELKNATDTINELQHALVEMQKERDALQEERDGLVNEIDEYGEPEELYDELSGAADDLAKMEKERDDARGELKDTEHDFTNAEEEVERLEKLLAAAAKPTPPPVAPRRKSPSLTIEDRLAALETENDRLLTGMHNFNVDRNEADEKIAALEKHLHEVAATQSVHNMNVEPFTKAITRLGGHFRN